MAYKIEDHADLDTAIMSLKAAGFQKASAVDEHYWHPVRMENGYWQRADAFTLPNLGEPFARISFWDANA